METCFRPPGRTLFPAALNEFDDLSRLRVPAEGELGVDQLTVDRHFERAPGALDQLHRSFGESLRDLGRQTGSPRVVVSDDAVLNSDLHHRSFRSG